MLLRPGAQQTGAPADRPSLAYLVMACGDNPFNGVLPLGGQTRRDGITVTDICAMRS
jgi:hypothetical protein